MTSLVQQARALLNRALRRARRRGWDAKAKRIEMAQDDLTPPVKVRYPGVAAARAQSEAGGFPGDPGGDNPGAGWCLKMVRLCYGIGPKYPDADAAWHGARRRHPQTSSGAFPRGYPVFWTGGSGGHGHVAISAGGGMVWSTDIRRAGFFDLVKVERIHDDWGLTLVGWTEDLNGVRVPAEVEGVRHG